MSKILKIRYTITYFNLELYKPGARKVIEILPNGNIVVKTYSAGKRKAKEIKEYHSSETDVCILENKIRACINSANSLSCFIDDSDAELVIYYDYGRREHIPRGLGNGEETVGRIIMGFISQYSD